jgi:hypothetical protein
MATIQEGVVLCGPPCVGKTMCGSLVAEALGWAFVDADRDQASWLVERGWGAESFSRRVSEVGRPRAYLEYEILMAEYLGALLAGHPAGVIALGAGHAHARGAETAHRMVGALRAESRPVVRLLPEPDRHVAYAVIRARVSGRADETYRRPGRDLIAEWIESRVMKLAADHTLYTHQDSPAVVAGSLVRLLTEARGVSDGG